jgi:hypothetical protein
VIFRQFSIALHADAEIAVFVVVGLVFVYLGGYPAEVAGCVVVQVVVDLHVVADRTPVSGAGWRSADSAVHYLRLES